MSTPTEIAETIAATLNAHGIKTKVWTGNKRTRVYIRIFKLESGFIGLDANGQRDYESVERRKESIREWCEGALSKPRATGGDYHPSLRAKA